MPAYLLNTNIEFYVPHENYRRSFHFIKMSSVISNALIHTCLGIYSCDFRIRFTCAADRGRK